jgi:hypothetical protein
VRRLLALQLVALTLLLPLTPRAQEQEQQGLAPAPDQEQENIWIPKTTAELQLLDKVTARVSVLHVPLNQTAQFGTLGITVRACNARPPDEVPDAVAWMEVTDSRRPADQNLVFRGWMFANAPAVNMLEHPVYDLRVLECQ